MKWKLLIILMLAIPIVYAAINCDLEEECLITETCQDADCGNCSLELFDYNGTSVSDGNMVKSTDGYTYSYNITNNIIAGNTYFYTINCSTNQSCKGDCQVVVDDTNYFNSRYYLYIISFILLLSLLILGYWKQEGIFVIMGGMLCLVMALYLFHSGFPNLTNDTLKQWIIIIITGIGMYLILAPSLEYLEEFKGGFG